MKTGHYLINITMILPKNWSEERKRATSVWCMAIIFIGLLAFGGYSVYSTIFNPFKISPENARLADQFRAAIAAQQLQADQQRQALMDQFNKSASLQKPTTPEVSVPGLPTPTELRDALKKSGATDAQLSQISDSELMSAYNQTLADQQKSGAQPATGVATSTPSTAPTSTTLEQLSQMTPAQIRDLLLKNGMSRADLDKMDDKTLQATFRQVLTEQIAAQSAATNNSAVK